MITSRPSTEILCQFAGGGGAGGPLDAADDAQIAAGMNASLHHGGGKSPLLSVLYPKLTETPVHSQGVAGAAAVTERGGEADSVCHTHYNKVDFLKTSLSLCVISLSRQQNILGSASVENESRAGRHVSITKQIKVLPH